MKDKIRKIYFQAYKDEPGKIIKLALSADDILRGGDSGVIERSRACTSDLTRFTLDTALCDFVTRCATSGNPWEQRIQMMDFNYIIPEEERVELDPFISFDQIKQQYPDLMKSDLLVHCMCPAYKFWAYQYIMTQFDTALEQETIAPREYTDDPRRNRNFMLEGTVCKHLYSVLDRFYR